MAGNGLDDDRNGYVDDIHGWNFIGGPSGEQVDEDTYELTRLVAVCRAGNGRRRPLPLRRRVPALRGRAAPGA